MSKLRAFVEAAKTGGRYTKAAAIKGAEVAGKVERGYHATESAVESFKSEMDIAYGRPKERKQPKKSKERIVNKIYVKQPTRKKKKKHPTQEQNPLVWRW